MTDSIKATAQWHLVVALLAAVGSGAVSWWSQKHLETLWDEQVDHDIAVGLRDHPLTGGADVLDASQMRLPMYAVAAAYRLTGRDDLPTARAVSLVFGGLTVLGAAALAGMLYGRLAAAVSAVLLAFSPYFLAFARISMTEGDVALACFTTLACWGFVRYLERSTPGRWLTAAVLLGLALGAKFFAGFLVIIFALAAWRQRKESADLGPRSWASSSLLGESALAPAQTGIRSRTSAKPARRLGLTVVVPSVAALAITTSLALLRPDAAPIGWGLLVLAWLSAVVRVSRASTQFQDPWRALPALVVMAAVTACVLLPVHCTRIEIAKELARRVVGWVQPGLAGTASDAVSLADHLRLYSGILAIKTTPPLAALSILALLLEALTAPRDPRRRLCIASFLVYVVILSLLPLRQTFYLMGVYPLLAIMTAGFTVRVGRWLAGLGRLLAVGWAVLCLGILVHLGVDLARSYPHFQLYGHERIGNTWLGAESRGYRNLIQTPSDGVESLLRWCNTSPRVVQGDRIVSFLWEEHIIDRCVPPAPHYHLIRRGLDQHSNALPPQPSIEDADFVLLHINNLLGYGDRPPDWPPAELLGSRFHVVHEVRRGTLAVAWVYGRRGSGVLPVP